MSTLYPFPLLLTYSTPNTYVLIILPRNSNKTFIFYEDFIIILLIHVLFQETAFFALY